MDLSHGELMHWSGHNVLKVFTICPKVLKEAQNTSKAKLHLCWEPPDKKTGNCVIQGAVSKDQRA